MKVKNRKAAIFSILASLSTIMLTVILPARHLKSIQDFVRGILTGMGAVTAVIWLVYLITYIARSRSGKVISVLYGMDKNILLALTMTLLLIISIISIYLSNSILISFACFVTIAVSYVLNIFYIKRNGGKGVCNN